MKICAFLLKVNGKFSKGHNIALKIMILHKKKQKRRLKVRKKAPRNAENGPAGLKSEPGWAKMGPPGSFLATLDVLLATWCSTVRICMHF